MSCCTRSSTSRTGRTERCSNGTGDHSLSPTARFEWSRRRHDPTEPTRTAGVGASSRRRVTTYRREALDASMHRCDRYLSKHVAIGTSGIGRGTRCPHRTARRPRAATAPARRGGSTRRCYPNDPTSSRDSVGSRCRPSFGVGCAENSSALGLSRIDGVGARRRHCG